MAGSGVLRFRWTIALAWLAAAAALLPLAPGVEDRLEVSARILGSESAEVDRLLVERFESPFARSALLVLAGVPAPDRPEGRAVLDRVVRALAERPEVTGTFSYRDQEDAFFVGAGGGTFVVVGLDAGRGPRRPPPARAAPGHGGRCRPSFAPCTHGRPCAGPDRRPSTTTSGARAPTRPTAPSGARCRSPSRSSSSPSARSRRPLLTVASGALAVGLALGAGRPRRRALAALDPGGQRRVDDRPRPGDRLRAADGEPVPRGARDGRLARRRRRPARRGTRAAPWPSPA